MFEKSDYELGDQVFLSYRGHDVELAEGLASSLKKMKLCKNVRAYKPESLCIRDEILTTYDYVELMESIIETMKQSDTFVFLDTGDYLDSYFTQTELLHWRRIRKSPRGYRFLFDNEDKSFLKEEVIWDTLSENKSRAWASITIHVNPSYTIKATTLKWGKYSRNCFIIPCGRCGENFLLSGSALRANLNSEYDVICPHCGNNRFQFEVKSDQKSNFKRKPIVLNQEIKTLRILEPDEIFHLLLENELPTSIPLVALDNENLSLKEFALDLIGFKK
jgi:hypothetical protein